MMICGLLGRRLGHSYSPQIHARLGSYRYSLFEKEPEDLEAFLKEGDFTGINVTIPYKKNVMPFLDDLSPTARAMGAVNTIVRRSDGSLYGHNTDHFGFASMVCRTQLEVAGKKALVLGSGGASNTAVHVLREMGAEVVVISRTGENNYNNLHLHKDAAVLVNATPVGMFPNTGDSPVDLRLFPKLEGVLDLIYNPARTRLLQQAEELGLARENGLWMLVAQAKEAAEYFTGSTISDAVIESIHRTLSGRMQNIILIGMPGCGKTTVGSLLAKKTGRPFFDADEWVVQQSGRPIPEIFRTEGEDAFRRRETRALAELGKRSGCIIATGGGCVTRQENYPLLHQNGVLFRLDRSLDALPTDGRPLSQAGKLKQMLAVRDPLYAAFADHTVDNNTGAEAAAAKILNIMEEMA